MGAADKLLAEGTTDAGRTRAERYRSLFRGLFGERPPLTQALPIPEVATYPSLSMSGRRRAEVEAAAKAVFDGFVGLDFRALRRHAAEEVVVLWGDGTLARHLSKALLFELEDRGTEPVWVMSDAPRSYAWAELRNQLPQRVALHLDDGLDLSGSVVCSTFLDGPKETIGRLMVVMRPDPRGRWRACTLPLPSVDSAVAASKRASLAEEDWVRFADKIVRLWLLHNTNQLRALRNHMMDQVLFKDDAVAPEQMFEKLDKRAPPADRLELVFLGSEAAPFESIDDQVGRAVHKAITLRAEEVWNRTLEQLRPKLVVTALGKLGPEQKPAPDGRAVLLMVRRVEQDQRNERREHWRLAGLWRVSQ